MTLPVNKQTNYQSGIAAYQILLPLELKLTRGHCRDRLFCIATCPSHCQIGSFFTKIL